MTKKAEKNSRGRPLLPPDQAQTAMIRERVTEAERVKYDRLGGKEWLRAALKRARET
jgi:hypothetical protein